MWQLERLAPAEKRGECIELDASRPLVRVGRSEDSDLRLYSPTASRAHAELRCEADGSWWIEPLPGCSVLADGAPVTGPCELCQGLCLEIGRDRLRCRAPESRRETALTGPGPAGQVAAWHRPLLWLGALIILAVVFLRTCG